MVVHRRQATHAPPLRLILCQLLLVSWFFAHLTCVPTGFEGGRKGCERSGKGHRAGSACRIGSRSSGPTADSRARRTHPASSHGTLPGVQGPITPGMGAGETPSRLQRIFIQPQPVPAAPPPSPSQPPAATAPPQNAQDTPPEEGVRAVNTVIHAQVNEVIVPVTVKDPKGNPVAGLTWRISRSTRTTSASRCASSA